MATYDMYTSFQLKPQSQPDRSVRGKVGGSGKQYSSSEEHEQVDELLQCWTNGQRSRETDIAKKKAMPHIAAQENML